MRGMQAERQRYAERWAQTMHEDAERILAFQHAYDAAIRRLYPGESLIDPGRLPEPSEKTGSLEPGDRVLFFTRAECPVCDALFGRLIQKIDAIAGIDIYLSGEHGGDDEAVRDWAKHHAIQPEWVRSRRVTLNHDAGALEQLTHGEGEVPFSDATPGRGCITLTTSGSLTMIGRRSFIGGFVALAIIGLSNPVWSEDAVPSGYRLVAV